jgi:hypothetical protein
MEDNTVTPNAQSAEPGQLLFQCANFTSTLLQASQGVAHPAARFRGQRL